MFKVGDWVQVNSPVNFPIFTGKVGVIEVVDGPNERYPYRVALEDEGSSSIWSESELIPAKPEDVLALEVLGEEYFA